MRKIQVMALAGLLLSTLNIHHTNAAAADARTEGEARDTSRILRATTVLFEYRSYFHRGHSCHPVNEREIVEEHKTILRAYADSLMAHGHYRSLLALADEYLRTPKYSHSSSGGFPAKVNMSSSCVDEVTGYIREYSRELIERNFGHKLLTGQFTDALSLINVLPEGGAEDLPSKPDMLARLRASCESKVREHGELAAALRDVNPDLGATQLAKAREIIAAFPEGDAIRTRLESVWAEVSAVPAPVLPTDAELAVRRGVMEDLARD